MRYPSPIVKISFEGPDVDEETLYSLLRVRHFPSKEVILDLFSA